MMPDYDVEDAFAAIEDELIASMIRNMRRHHLEEMTEDKQWAMWQAMQLESLERYKKANQKKFGSRFSDINGRIGEVIREANKRRYMDQETEILKAIQSGFQGYRRMPDTMQAEFFKLNERKLETLIHAVEHDMEKAETAILRRADDQYRKAIFNAQVYANTGAGTYEKAVDMATKDMLSAGLKCVVYANGAMHTLQDYADMALRTTSKRAYLQGEGLKRQEWGITTVIVNKRGNPCPKCLPFCGKILIDDVWSGGSKDGISPVTGLKYPLISSAIVAGLYHPRCKDSHTTYFEGISTPPDSKYTRKELDQIAEDYRKEAEQQYAERQAEKFDRLAKYSLDSENRKQYHEKAGKWGEQADLFRGIKQKIDQITFDHEPVSIFELESKYRNDILDIVNHAPQNVKSFIVKYQDDIVFVNERAERNREGKRGIRVNLKKDAADERGKWCGTFHEIGHRVDRLAGRPSGKPEFENALRNDFERLVKGYQEQYNVSRSDAYKEMSGMLRDPMYHSVSDILGGISNNELVGSYRHRPEYWRKKEKLGREAFAHFFEAVSRDDVVKTEVLRQTFPEAYQMFENMLEELK